MARANRQLKILDIISKHDVDTQEELVDYLRSEGFAVTQATVSRDIKEMGIIKTLSSDGRHYKYAAQQTKEATAADKFLSMFKNTVISIKSSGNLIVLKTEAGSAGPALPVSVLRTMRLPVLFMETTVFLNILKNLSAALASLVCCAVYL